MPKLFYLFKLKILSLSQKRARKIYSHTSVLKLIIIKFIKNKKVIYTLHSILLKKKSQKLK